MLLRFTRKIIAPIHLKSSQYITSSVPLHHGTVWPLHHGAVCDRCTTVRCVTAAPQCGVWPLHHCAVCDRCTTVRCMTTTPWYDVWPLLFLMHICWIRWSQPSIYMSSTSVRTRGGRSRCYVRSCTTSRHAPWSSHAGGQSHLLGVCVHCVWGEVCETILSYVLLHSLIFHCFSL